MRKRRLSSQSQPQEGDVYRFRGVDPADDYWWVLIKRHPDDESVWYLATMRYRVIAGVLQVEVPGNVMPWPDTHSSVLFPECGIWAQISQICAKGEFVSFIPDEFVSRAKQNLACLARGKHPTDSTQSQKDNEDLDELWEEIYRGNRMSVRLEELLNS